MTDDKREITNPGVRRGVCIRHPDVESRMDRIEQTASSTQEIAQQTLNKVCEMQGEQRGAAKAQERGSSKASTWAAVLGVLLAVLLAIVSAVWTIADRGATDAQALDTRALARDLATLLRDSPRPAAPAEPGPGG